MDALFWIVALFINIVAAETVSLQSPKVLDALTVLRGGRVFTAEEIQAIIANAVPGIDYPINTVVPPSTITCASYKQPGYYADASVQSRCQVFHRCDLHGVLTSYLCPNATLLNQITLICDWFFNVDCNRSAQFADYSNSRALEANAVLLDNQDDLATTAVPAIVLGRPLTPSPTPANPARPVVAAGRPPASRLGAGRALEGESTSTDAQQFGALLSGTNEEPSASVTRKMADGNLSATTMTPTLVPDGPTTAVTSVIGIMLPAAVSNGTLTTNQTTLTAEAESTPPTVTVIEMVTPTVSSASEAIMVISNETATAESANTLHTSTQVITSPATDTAMEITASAESSTFVITSGPPTDTTEILTTAAASTESSTPPMVAVLPAMVVGSQSDNSTETTTPVSAEIVTSPAEEESATTPSLRALQNMTQTFEGETTSTLTESPALGTTDLTPAKGLEDGLVLPPVNTTSSSLDAETSKTTNQEETLVDETTAITSESSTSTTTASLSQTTNDTTAQITPELATDISTEPQAAITVGEIAALTTTTTVPSTETVLESNGSFTGAPSTDLPIEPRAMEGQSLESSTTQTPSTSSVTETTQPIADNATATAEDSLSDQTELTTQAAVVDLNETTAEVNMTATTESLLPDMTERTSTMSAAESQSAVIASAQTQPLEEQGMSTPAATTPLYTPFAPSVTGEAIVAITTPLQVTMDTATAPPMIITLQPLAIGTPLTETGAKVGVAGLPIEVSTDMSTNLTTVPAVAVKPGSSRGAGRSLDDGQTPKVWDALLELRGRNPTVQNIRSRMSNAVPGKDYPVNVEIPPNDFSCKSFKQPGFYADTSEPSRCQVYHRCDSNGRKTSYLCPSATLFNQITLVCDWFFNVDCDNSAQFADYSNSRLQDQNAVLLDDHDNAIPFPNNKPQNPR